MVTYLSDLHEKEVIDIHTGFRLGFVSDAELDDRSGQLRALITPGRAKFFGLLGREDDYVLPWECIVRVGRDIVLVESKEQLRRRKPRKML